MRFNILPTLLTGLLATTALAAPAAEPVAAAAPALVARDPSAQCNAWNDFAVIYWEVYNIYGWGDDWGHGLLDNLRGQCGVITTWQYWQDNGGWKASFFTAEGVDSHCVENAIWLAGGVGGVHCDWHVG